MSIKDKMKNAKESRLFDELSEKEKFEAILEGKLKVRLIAELEKIKTEISEITFITTAHSVNARGMAFTDSINKIIDEHISTL